MVDYLAQENKEEDPEHEQPCSLDPVSGHYIHINLAPSRVHPETPGASLQQVLEDNKNLRLERDKLETLYKVEHEKNLNLSFYKKNKNFAKIYCMVPSMFHPKKFAAMSAILRTWGKRCDVLKFFVDPIYEDELELNPELKSYVNHTHIVETKVYEGEDLVSRRKVGLPKKYTDAETGLSAELVEINMKRRNDIADASGKVAQKKCWAGGAKDKDGNTKYVACRHIWEKVWRSWVHIHDEVHTQGSPASECSYFLKIDDDTYFFPDFLRLLDQNPNWIDRQPGEELSYFGHRLLHGKVKTGFIAGAMVGYSRKTLDTIVPVYRSMPNEYGDRTKFKHGRCVDRDGATQEVTESLCLSQNGIIAQDMSTADGMSRITLHTVIQSLKIRKKPDTSYWFWKKQEPWRTCCATIPLAFHHYKKASNMMKMDNLFFNEEERVVRDEFSSYIFKDELKTKTYSIWKPIDDSNRDKFVEQGSNLDKWLEFQYILSVRENIGLYSLFDPSYKNISV
eukprot:snap_masked-scaffold_3-processed-gene-12.28-mRNA-1 protein AED:1.00 eAED:1.00 QI:0/0/0/0/1/1/2/0/507